MQSGDQKVYAHSKLSKTKYVTVISAIFISICAQNQVQCKRVLHRYMPMVRTESVCSLGLTGTNVIVTSAGNVIRLV